MKNKGQVLLIRQGKYGNISGYQTEDCPEEEHLCPSHTCYGRGHYAHTSSEVS